MKNRAVLFVLICFFTSAVAWCNSHQEVAREKVAQEITNFFRENFDEHDPRYELIATHLIRKSQQFELLDQKSALHALQSKQRELVELNMRRAILKNEIAAMRQAAAESYRTNNMAYVAQKEVQVASLNERILDVFEQALLVPFLAQNGRPEGYTNTLTKRSFLSLGSPAISLIGSACLLAMGIERGDPFDFAFATITALYGAIYGTARTLKLLELKANKDAHLALESSKSVSALLLAANIGNFEIRCDYLLQRARIETELPIEAEDAEDQTAAFSKRKSL